MALRRNELSGPAAILDAQHKEIRRLRRALVETAQALTLEQLKELSEESVRTLADVGLPISTQ